jgi:Mn-containing catalase
MYKRTKQLAYKVRVDEPNPVFAKDQEKQEFSYEFFVHSDGEVPGDAGWTSGPSIDSKDAVTP